MEGYAKLSSLMGTDPEFAIYRKFAALNAQNLLYYQAELMGLEAEKRACWQGSSIPEDDTDSENFKRV